MLLATRTTVLMHTPGPVLTYAYLEVLLARVCMHPTDLLQMMYERIYDVVEYELLIYSRVASILI